MDTSIFKNDIPHADDLPSIRVGSTTYGKGVFAQQTIQADETIGPIVGTVIDDPDYGSEYCIDLGGTLSLDPKPPFRFLNHSCEPNCEIIHELPSGAAETGAAETGAAETGAAELGAAELDDWDFPVCGLLRVVALKEIACNEQLTIDYDWPADGAIRCACGSPRCRGWIISPDELTDFLALQENLELRQPPSHEAV